MKYSYLAKNSAGKTIGGEMDAMNEIEVRNRLRQMNLNVLQLNVKGGTLTGVTKIGSKGSFFKARVKIKDLQIFTRQFATLINAGIPVVDALKVLGEGLRSGVLKEAVISVKQHIESGKKLSDSMTLFPLVFDKFYSNMIHAGEEAGILDSILGRLALYMEKNEKIKGQIKGAMFYPAMIVIVAIGVIAAILMFVIPKFQDMFAQAGKEPPLLTTMVVNLSKTLTNYWYFIFGGLGVAVYSFIEYIRTPTGKAATETFLYHAPVFGELTRKGSIARVTRTLATLLSSGIGLIEALEIASKTAGNIIIEKSLSRSKEAVLQGKPLASTLSKDKVFPDMVVQMISVGEQSGTLDNMLTKIADFYDDEVEVAVKGLTSLIEPILMIVLGGIIAVLVVAMYLPIFSMAGNVSGGGGAE